VDVFHLRDQLTADYERYVSSFLSLRDNRIRERVATALAGGQLWPESRIGLSSALEPGGWIDELVTEGPLHPKAAEVFTARFKVGGTHVNLFIAKQLAVLPPAALEAVCPWSRGSVADWLAPRTLELTYTAWDLAGFAADLGWHGPPFHWNPERRALLRAEIDAAMFLLFGLDRDDVDYVMDTFPIVRRNDEKAYGEYRTKRLILERYDALVHASRTGRVYESPLDSSPAGPRCAHDPSTRPDRADLYA
jgi:hypothetical protein